MSGLGWVGAVLLSAAVSIGPYEGTIRSIEKRLEGALDAAARGDSDGAWKRCQDAYFEEFENGMEQRVKARLGGNRAFRLEQMFTEARRAIVACASGKGSRAEAERRASALVAALREADAALGSTSPLPSPAPSSPGPGPAPSEPVDFGWAFFTIFREGLEAVLILMSLLGATARMGGGEGRRLVLRGAFFAVLASIVTAVVLRQVVGRSSAGQDVLEGYTMLFAAAVLFYVSFWLVSRVDRKRWREFLSGQVRTALGKGGRFALALTAFLAVYREGAETILFYQPVMRGGNGAAVAGGFLAGVAALGAVCLVQYRLNLRLPLRRFFAASGALLYGMAVVSAGKGIHELQEAGFSATPVRGGPLIDALGVYPTLETLAAQGLLVAAAIAAGAVLLFRSRIAVEAAERPLPAKEA